MDVGTGTPGLKKNRGGISAVNLKFLSLWPQARSGTSNSKPH
jgi:hypothetical protein